MRRQRTLALLGFVLALAACQANGSIRVYVEPTYEQKKLQQLLAAYPDLHLLLHPGTEDVSLRVEAIPQPASVRSVRAAIRAQARRSGYEVYAVAELLPHKSQEALRARWVNSYMRGLFEDNFADILHLIAVEGAREDHRTFQRTREEVERLAASLSIPRSP